MTTQVSIDDVLCRFLKKAGVSPGRSSDVRDNWLHFLRLCVKSEEAWRREGWDRKSPDAILEEIYVQGKDSSTLVLRIHFASRIFT